ncbi:MAG: hypothetical protein SVN78_03725 [Deferribacterota bacterium]|nr:hypothetical protein [Deferribacterota bacterium]
MTVECREYFLDKKNKILDDWFNHLISHYDDNKLDYLEKERDPFLNPVKYIFKSALGSIFSYIFEDEELDLVSQDIEKLIKLLALNGPKASEVLGLFVFFKQHINALFMSSFSLEEKIDEYNEITNIFDNLLLKIFDMYVQCREKIYEIRVNEIKRMTFPLLERSGLIERIDINKNNGL